jgi:hypothetical protein
MYRLGAQGRAVQRQLQQTAYATVVPQELPDTQKDVELLLSILTSKHSKHTAQQLLSYMAHYMPRVKNEDNVTLLMNSFLLNDKVFSSFEESYLVVEALKALFEQKIRISEPSLPLSKFFHGVLSAVYASPVESWRKTCVLTGITLSKQLYEVHSDPETHGYFEKCYTSVIRSNHEMIVQGFHSVSLNDYKVNSVWALSLACSLISFTDHMKAKLPHDAILMHIIDLVFSSPFGISRGPLQASDKPVVKHLSRLSFVVENCFLHGVKYPIMDASLSKILDFSFELGARTKDSSETWDFLKSVMFALVIMLQGYASFSLNIYNGLRAYEYSTLTTKVIKTLYLSNFIMEKIGTGGFQAYNFVLYTTMDGLFQHSPLVAQELGRFMILSLSIQLVPQSHYESSKALFALIFFESFTKTCDLDYYEQVVEPFVSHFINLPRGPPQYHHMHRQLVESAHSVILSTFTPRNAPITAARATSYLGTVLEQFPVFLSSRQLCLAVEAIAKNVAPPSDAYYLNKDNLREVLHTLYIAIINCPCSLLLKEEGTGGPRTVRAALISSLISTVPFIPLTYVEQWLTNIWELSEGDSYLEDKLWKTISESVDMQRGTVGIQWWYNKSSLTQKL